MLRLLAGACAVLLVASASALSAAEAAKCDVTATLLDPNEPSADADLARGIVCLAQPISVKEGSAATAKPTATDTKAAKQIIVLAAKIIGNGSPMIAARPKGGTPWVDLPPQRDKIAAAEGTITAPAEPSNQATAAAPETTLPGSKPMAAAHIIDPKEPAKKATIDEGATQPENPDTNATRAMIIACQSRALLGDPKDSATPASIKCNAAPWSKHQVIELAAKIIGNG
ncbi:hypothetical protein HJB56_26240 [Rhizobium lentis]|uniref:hypothetical protein n=1 Tax=Rhizobium lentis TaxID=1138194 RepID=UPI001C835B76|nr:hypothetical protein [Rhizobium lentis]MBX5086230.1 hypothetical protein [Rhizobium lentis]MBX5096342.1 hypothetical protein [Rhizobium lentis]MBX5123510.1 hypothetical protein [Rhizobium lentis]